MKKLLLAAAAALCLITPAQAGDGRAWGVARHNDGTPYAHDPSFTIAVECDGTLRVLVMRDSPIFTGFYRHVDAGYDAQFSIDRRTWRASFTIEAETEDGAFFSIMPYPEPMAALVRGRSVNINAGRYNVNATLRGSGAAMTALMRECN